MGEKEGGLDEELLSHRYALRSRWGKHGSFSRPLLPRGGFMVQALQVLSGGTGTRYLFSWIFDIFVLAGREVAPSAVQSTQSAAACIV